jgi:hypothetical protein
MPLGQGASVEFARSIDGRVVELQLGDGEHGRERQFRQGGS